MLCFAAKQVLCAGLGAYAESRDWQQAMERLLQARMRIDNKCIVFFSCFFILRHVNPTKYMAKIGKLIGYAACAVSFASFTHVCRQNCIQWHKTWIVFEPKCACWQIELLVPGAQARNAETV